MEHKYKYLTDEFLKKSEIGKYIEVFNAGYSSFAPISIGDYNSSITQMESILEHLQCLNYDKLMVETTSDQIDKLKRSKVSNEDFIYQLHFIRDREIIIKEVPKMFEKFKKYAKDLVSKGLWTEEQRFKYAICCNDITKLFVEQLNNFWACVGDMGYKPQNQQQDDRCEYIKKEGKVYFDKAIELGLMDSNYKWLKGLQLLACFAREMSIRLNLCKAENSDGSPRISWKPFETLFSIEAGKLRLNYNDIQKTGQQPKESDLIDKVFE